MSFRTALVASLILLGGPVAADPALRFEENVGQVDPRVRFLCRTAGFTLYLTGDEAVFDLGRSSMRLAFVDGNPAVETYGVEPLPGRTNYLIGRDPARWRSGIRSHGRVVYDEIYPGIDLVFREHAGKIEFDFVLEPGAEPSAIVLAAKGAERLHLDAGGALRLSDGNGELSMQAPTVYQTIDGSRVAVDGRFVVGSDRRIRFSVGDYDRDRSLVIDPILSFSTYLGGEQADEIRDMAVDDQGNTYVVGWTLSSNFPLADAMDDTLDSNNDGFVSKLGPDGSTLIYSTYFGGDRDDNRNSAAITVNAAGEVFLAGETNGGTFPTTGGAYEEVPQGVADCYVAKLSADGSTLLYSTILGGSSADRCWDVQVDGEGAAYVTGVTNGPGFPTTAGAFQETPTNAFTEAFAAKVNAVGSGLVYSTFLGGSSHDTGTAIALVGDEVVVTGFTSSTDFPLAAAFQGVYGGARDAFVTRLNASGSGLVFSGYHGGSGEERGLDVAPGSDGGVYLTGYTRSADMPTTAGAFQQVFGEGGHDAFAVRVDGTGSLVYSTYLGGSLLDRGLSIAVRDDWARVAGETTSSDFPTLAPIQAGQANPSVPGDVFVATLSPDGGSLAFSTYLGGNGKENTRDQAGLSLGPDGALHVAGSTGAEDFPTTAGSFQDADPDAGDNSVDGFVVKIHECDVVDLRFLATKTDFEWSATGLGQCGVLFDVARGDLAALTSSGGDFSAALCLENDDADMTASDVDTPAAGDGFWYLARVDGSTWNAAGTAGDRDATLADCP